MITPVPLPFDLVQIDRLCGPVSCRRFLKKEYLEEVAKQRILANVLRKRLALLSKLRLNGRDENPILHSSDTRQWSAAEMPRTTYIQQVKLYQKTEEKGARWARQNGQASSYANATEDSDAAERKERFKRMVMGHSAEHQAGLPLYATCRRFNTRQSPKACTGGY